MSLMNDERVRDFGALLLTEQHGKRINGRYVVTPAGHANWWKVLPSVEADSRFAFRSMMWVRKDIKAEQLAVDSPDVTAVVADFKGKKIALLSVYIPKKSNTADRELKDALGLIQLTIRRARRERGVEEIVVAGDFNRHSELWGGLAVTANRQGEGQPIIDLMAEEDLQSLLPCGIKTWQRNDQESTIDIILTSPGLANSMIECGIHEREHGSDHRAIETTFEMDAGVIRGPERLLFKNAPWGRIQGRIRQRLLEMANPNGTQRQADRLLAVVYETVMELTPRARPSPYAKRWWTESLSQLRDTYTYWRKQARRERRWERGSPETEREARNACRNFHRAIRHQKKKHWEEYIGDEKNIWGAARFLDHEGGSAFDKVPQLCKQDGTVTNNQKEQVEELLSTFFPPTPTEIDPEDERIPRIRIQHMELQEEEIQRKVFEAKPWKAPGRDGLPAGVWRNIWPAVKEDVVTLFRSSLREGVVPLQWKEARIIPLKKPRKEKYTAAKAWRPISLLPSLGKILEAVIAERISFMAEEYGLLPGNHYGARKGRGTEQAMVHLQERIFRAWRAHKVLSLVSFDVKGAYNGVVSMRLQQRLLGRSIPPELVRWIGAFCSERRASIMVNGEESEIEAVEHPGLPQGSPLSPILFIFYNADLVQRKNNGKGGAMAYVDDYSAWVVGDTAAANTAALEGVVEEATGWERRSGATFEEEKTTLIHFTRVKEKGSVAPLMIKGTAVIPKEEAKILGVIWDSELRFKNHIANASKRGVVAALALRRMKALPPSVARQLFIATVAPVYDYAAAVWMHAARAHNSPTANTMQKLGAQAVTGVFKTVAVAVAEAEAGILTIKERHDIRAAKMIVEFQSLPSNNPMYNMRAPKCKRFISPLQKMQSRGPPAPLEDIERIEAYAVSPWEERIRVWEDGCEEGMAERIQRTWQMGGVTVILATKEVKGRIMCGARYASLWGMPTTTADDGGPKGRQNPLTAELGAIARVAEAWIEANGALRELMFASRNRAMLQVLKEPRRQSGQQDIRRIYAAKKEIEKSGGKVTGCWIKTAEDIPLWKEAREAGKKAIINQEHGRYQAVSTAKSYVVGALKNERSLPTNRGSMSKWVDKALPGPHTKGLYDPLRKEEAKVLAQLRTGMSRLNGYLYKIGATESAECSCGAAKEDVGHFLFRCEKWEPERQKLRNKWGTKMGNARFFLGGKGPRDDGKWKPDQEAVRAAIRFAITTRRLVQENEGVEVAGEDSDSGSEVLAEDAD